MLSATLFIALDIFFTDCDETPGAYILSEDDFEKLVSN